MDHAPSDVTRLLIDWSGGDQSAFDQLMPLVHQQLRQLARRHMVREHAGHTLQATALVNEAYLRLVGQKQMRWQNRAHFYAISAQMMRRILVDYARKRLYAKRGGGEAIKVPLTEADGVFEERAADVAALDDALTRLAEIEPQQHRVVELKFFTGLTIEEIAEVLGISRDMVKRDWAAAKAWLYQEMTPESGARVETRIMAFAAEALEADKTQSRIGSTVGHYTILSPLGAGGMGEVFLARDARLGRNVALKILPGEFTIDSERLRRFRVEASAASRLNHPGILTIYEVGQDESTHFIASEFVDGRTLRAVMADQPFSIIEALDAALQAAAALSAAHAAGIVHRDIKPDNVMLRSDGVLKVLDFGIAKLIDGRGEHLPSHTDPGSVMGTAAYMSPEQARGQNVDARTDIWSLGVVLYEMVAGRLPFDGSNSADLLVSIIERHPAPLSERADAIPDALERLVRTALAKDRRERHASIDDLAADLRTIKQDLEFSAALRRRAGGDTAVDSGFHRSTGGDVDNTSRRANNNLSTEVRSIVGRDVELASLEAALRDPQLRLITLTGPGGTGKTRLSQQAVRSVLPVFGDGVFFVALAPITDHLLVIAAIAQTLGIVESSTRSYAAGLRQYLQDKQLLLVLDNFEHVIDAAPAVGELLGACPGVTMLVTSRSTLRISGEREFVVPPLALPPAGERPTADSLLRSGAPLLFVQRVLMVKPRFVVTDANAPTIAEICARLDGLPLALELAAARTRLLSLEELLSRMTDRLALLRGGARDLPARQQTMRAAIAWSYDLLGADEQTLFNRQAVFLGGFTVAAAEAVCDTVDGRSVDVLDCLAALVDESLVQKKELPDGSYRFLTLETIREYALEHLRSTGESAAMRRQHAGFFLELAESAEPHLMSAGREPWLRRLDAEHNNLRAALAWTLETGDADTGLRLAGALRWFWYFRGHFGEGYHWATQLLAMSGAAARTSARAKALYCAGGLAFYFSNPAAAYPLLMESVAIWRELGDSRQLARALTFASLPTSLAQRAFAEARAQAEESVALFRGLDDRWGLALALTYAGVIMWTDPEAEARAPALFKESVHLFRTLGDEWGAAGSVLYLGGICQEQGDAPGARARYEEFVAAMRESRDGWRLASGLDILAELLRAGGEPDRAGALATESGLLQRKLGKSLNLRQTWDRMKRQGAAAQKAEP
jgi:non-specific serine/threonine protein kinase